MILIEIKSIIKIIIILTHIVNVPIIVKVLHILENKLYKLIIINNMIIITIVLYLNFKKDPPFFVHLKEDKTLMIKLNKINREAVQNQPHFLRAIL
jgi:hypothetical protein